MDTMWQPIAWPKVPPRRHTGQVSELIDALGGSAAVARALRVRLSAVSQWKARQTVPASRHAKLFAMAQARGIDWRPPGFERLAVAPQAPPAQANPQAEAA